MALKQTEEDTFESLMPAWAPAPFRRAFGGHVYAQSVFAASKTVGTGFVVHQVTGYFILPGAVDVPFVYRVRRIRDGGAYCLRSVDVFQESEAAASGKTPCFVATVSFKRPERSNGKWREFNHQCVPRNHLTTTYREVLEGKEIEDHPSAPGADALWWEVQEQEAWNKEAAVFPGVETRKVDMNAYNGTVEEGGGKDGEGTTRWRQLLFYRIIADEEEADEPVDLNLHAAAHMYASDRNSLFLIQRAAGYHQIRTTMASLSHTVVFHRPADSIRMTDETGKPKWFVQEAWTTFNGDLRGTHNSYLWNFEEGEVLATTLQDGMMRFPSSSEESSKKPSQAQDESGAKSKL